MKGTIYSIGYTGLDVNDFTALLKHYEIVQLLDIRRFPNSKTNPEFNQGDLKRHLLLKGIYYDWHGEKLGGFRDEGYEAYMCTSSFRRGIQNLKSSASAAVSAMMCLERNYMQCHRRFIADLLIRQNWRVRHIQSQDVVIDHAIQGNLFNGSDGAA